MKENLYKRLYSNFFMEKCSSCKKQVVNVKGSTRFKCPGCGKEEIVRCYECRRLATKYICKKCEFKGPN